MLERAGRGSVVRSRGDPVQGMGGMAGELPPEAMMQLAGIMGGGAPVDPMAGGAPMGPPTAGPIPGMPSTDPAVIQQLMQQDHMMLQAAQESAMATAAQGMGGMPMGPPPMPPAAAGMPGDPMAPAAPPLGDPMMGMVGGAAGLPPELAGAAGGPGFGAMEAGVASALPGDELMY